MGKFPDMCEFIEFICQEGKEEEAKNCMDGNHT
jgi:hypothetical protein